MSNRANGLNARSALASLTRAAAIFVLATAFGASSPPAFAATAPCQMIYEDCKVFAKEKKPELVAAILRRCEILYQFAQNEHLWASEKAQAAAGYKRPIKQLFCL